MCALPIYLRYGVPAVSQCRRDRVDGKLDALTYTRVIFSAAMALQQFDLKKIQRLYIRQTKTDRTIERRIPFQKPGLTGNGEQPIMGLLPSFPDAKIGRAHVLTPVTNAHRVCRLLLEKKNNTQPKNKIQKLRPTCRNKNAKKQQMNRKYKHYYKQ